MPELPEVETIKNAVCKAVGYCNIVDVIINQNRFRELIPDDFREKVIQTKITAYRRIAKYMVIDLSNGYSIIWHLGMSGRIKISDSVPAEPEKHDHVLIKTDNGVLIYNDARRFGLLTYCKTEELGKCHLLQGIGPDPFSEDFNAGYLKAKAKSRKTPVKVLLLDQKVVAGIGNIYASEALFDAGISPLRPADKVTPKECGKLVESIRRTLQKAIDAGGSTLKDYRRPDGSEGYFQFRHCVYNKTGQRCPGCRCNLQETGGIQKVIQAGRSSFFCPVKQR